MALRNLSVYDPAGAHVGAGLCAVKQLPEVGARFVARIDWEGGFEPEVATLYRVALAGGRSLTCRVVINRGDDLGEHRRERPSSHRVVIFQRELDA